MTSQPPTQGKAHEQRRRADALRANLKRRKAAARTVRVAERQESDVGESGDVTPARADE